MIVTYLKRLYIQMSVFIDGNKDSILIEECRSRYAKFLCLHRCVRDNARVPRDREPSRVPVKQLTRLLHKSRKIRKLVRKYIAKNVPKSSRIHCFVNKCNFIHEEVKCCPEIYQSKVKVRTGSGCSIRMRRILWSRKLPLKTAKFHRRTLSVKYSCSNTFKLLLTNHNLQTVYKNLNHRISHCKFTLSRDVETNPGPSTIDCSKTICAPYSQGNVALFGSNAGRQCVAMSLCALIYNHRSPICSSTDLANIMNIGNELYSVLSRLHNQDFLLLTELPDMITVLV